MTQFGAERALALVWLVLGIAVAYAGYGLGIGSTRDPGTGAFLFWPGLLVVLLALALVAKPSGPDVSMLDIRHGFPPRLLVAVVGSVAYAFVLEGLGFLIATALFLTITSRLVETRPWWKSVAFGIITATMIDLVGRILLGMPLPRGLLG
jgi:putative tricarboxylic transport membrane protein